MTIRSVFARVHRYAGLTTAAFLTIAGLTGSVIAFNHELDAWLNPDLFHVASRGEPLPTRQLIANVEQADPRIEVNYIALEREPGQSISMSVQPRIDSATGKPFDVEAHEVFVDPVTGSILGQRSLGCCHLGRRNIIPFLYAFHYSLYLPGNIGVYLMGIVAIIWVFDCFVAFYLTLPRGRPFFDKWKVAWTIKRNAKAYRRNLDLHRASGLWLWAVLLIMAVSAVSLNLPREVFRPAVSLLSKLTPDPFEEREALGQPPAGPVIPMADMLDTARVAAKWLGWRAPVNGVYYGSAEGLYSVGFGSTHAAGLGPRYLMLDATSGRVVGTVVPGQGTVGDVFSQIQFPLHSGQIAGLPGRILISLTGLVVAMLSVTGVMLWLKKTRSRMNGRARKSAEIEPELVGSVFAGERR
jgi:uncharacterized iron-regulated membrane protein